MLGLGGQGAHRPIGYHTTTLETLTALTRGQPIPLRHPQGKEKDVGSIVVDRATVEVRSSPWPLASHNRVEHKMISG